MLHDIDMLLGTSESENVNVVCGHINLTLPAAFGRRLVVPELTTFQRKYSEVDISCTLTDMHSNVIDEQIDIGLRTGFVRDNRYIAKKILDVHFFLVGSPELIARVGEPRSKGLLSQKPSLVLLDQQSKKILALGFKSGTFTPASTCFVTDDLDAYCEALTAGIGYGHIPGFLAFPLIESGKLMPVMPDVKSVTWGLDLFRQQKGPLPQRIRLLYDYLESQLSRVST